MLVMVLRWFIWFIVMVIDVGGRLIGIRGWGIIIKGSFSFIKNIYILLLFCLNKTMKYGIYYLLKG